jgi:general secretion pathway protein A
MYLEHFGLKAPPFPLTPDPANIYLGKTHREALAALQYGLVERRGFVTLVGEVGTGKTSIVYALLGDRGLDVRSAYLANPLQSFEDILASLLQDLGVRTAARTKRGILDVLNKTLSSRAAGGGTTALVIDEAQDLSDAALEELRLLSNFETYSEKLVQIVLVGQPELQERLARPHLRQLRERIAVHAAIAPLSRAEMWCYVAHCLERAGGSSERLFTRAALWLILRRCAGIPRRANILCHNALLFAYGRGRARVTARIAREAIAEMSERPHRRAFSRRALAGAVAAGAVAFAMVLTAGSRTRHGTPDVVRSAAAPLDPADIVRADVTVTTPAAGGTLALEAGRPSLADATPPVEAVAPPVPADAAVTTDSPRALVDPPSVGETRVVTVRAGATLYGLVRSVYGSGVDADRMYVEIQRLNPQLKDPNQIRAGIALRLPRGRS